LRENNAKLSLPPIHFMGVALGTRGTGCCLRPLSRQRNRAIFGDGANETARSSAISRINYTVVALSALWQIRIVAEFAGRSVAANAR
jgi:hypothetical protein